MIKNILIIFGLCMMHVNYLCPADAKNALVSAKNCPCIKCEGKKVHPVSKKERKVAEFLKTLPLAIGQKFSILEIVLDYAPIDVLLKPLSSFNSLAFKLNRAHYQILRDNPNLVNNVTFNLRNTAFRSFMRPFGSEDDLDGWEISLPLASPDVVFNKSDVDQASAIIRANEQKECTFTSTDGRYNYHIDRSFLGNGEIRGTYKSDIVKRLLCKE